MEQPSGTVTLFFSDVEGSTRLLHELGAEPYREALGKHRQLLRAAFARHGGYEVDYEGDAFFVAFADAAEAVAAADEAQVALADGPIQVRMGLHTGEPLLDPPKYIGVDVHLAARVMSAGHGGQILLTASTRDALEPSNNLLLGELGEHRLKDIEASVPLFQLGPRRFPPLKTISNTNLPRPVSSFVGREREVADLVSLLREGARLVTLTGPGGSGKTRLAIEAAAELVGEFTAGVFWVGLAALGESALVLETIAQTLGAKVELAAHVGERELLLLIDNLEQVVQASPELAGLVEVCPNLVLLVTSRELLRVRGEVEYEVLPLVHSDAVVLFCARARISPGSAVEELCRRLDNMPLALELAAARTKVLSPEQMLERLSEGLDLFRGGRDADPRQQTLRSTIEWSYDLLAAEERQLFARLAVFAGGCSFEAAEEVCDADLDTLQSLVEKSLLRHTDDRFWMLETIREFAGELLARSPDEAVVFDRHAEHFLALAGASRRALRGGEQAAWLARMVAEEANLRAALRRALEGGRAETALRLVWALEVFWIRAARDDEAVQWLDRAVALDCPAQPLLRARALATAGVFAALTGAPDVAAERFDQSIPLLRALEDEDGLAFALRGLVWLYEARGEAARAVAPLEEAITLFSALGHPVATRLCDLGDIAHAQGDRERARRSYERALAAGREEGDVSGQTQALGSLGRLAHEEGDQEQADEWLRDSLRTGVSWLDSSVSEAVCLLAVVAMDGDRVHEAARLVAVTEQLLEDAAASPAAREIRERLQAVEERLQSRDAAAFERSRSAAAAYTGDELLSWALGES